MRPLLRAASLLAWPILRPFVREVSGLENVPASGGCILIANHLSVFDGVILAAVMNRLARHTHFVSYGYLFQKPIVGTLLRFNRGVFLDETTAEGRERALDDCRRLLRDGEVIGLFPEGHTAPHGKMLKAQPGAAMLALETGCPVLPLGLQGTEKVVPRNGDLPGVRWGAVTVRFGPPPDLSRYHELFAHADRRRRLDIVLGVNTILMRAVAGLSDQVYPHGAKSLERLESLSGAGAG